MIKDINWSQLKLFPFTRSKEIPLKILQCNDYFKPSSCIVNKVENGNSICCAMPFVTSISLSLLRGQKIMVAKGA